MKTALDMLKGASDPPPYIQIVFLLLRRRVCHTVEHGYIEPSQIFLKRQESISHKNGIRVRNKADISTRMGAEVDQEQQLHIDSAFVLPCEHRPSKVVIQDDIPVIDLKGLWDSDSDSAYRRSVVEQVGYAAREWGFFQIVNHGVAGHLLDALEAAAKEFFGMPLEEKRKVWRSSVNPMGYYDLELTKNVRDWKEVFDFLCGERVEFDQVLVFENQWPQSPPEFRDACRKYAKAVEDVAFKVLELISESLGLPAKYLHEHFEGSSTRVRINHYAKCPAPDLVLGVSRHKDGCALTVLGQDEVGGLEVKRKDGEWIRVKPRRDAFAVNVGDLIQVWSNDKYQSVEHRVVVNTNKERFSCPLFFSPNYKTNVAPILALLDADRPARYKPVNWGEFFKMRRDSNFQQLGKPNVQIDHWAIAS